MIKIRYFSRLIVAFIKRFKTALIVGGIASFLLFFCFAALGRLFVVLSEERIAIVGSFQTSNLPSDLLNLIGEGLTHIQEDGKIAPALSESWTTTDGKTWVFKLKDNIFWQDGSEVVSGSIKYSLEDVSISHPDKKTIIFTLPHAFAPFPVVIARPTFKKGLLGTGQWKVDKIALSGATVTNLTLVNKNSHKKIFKFYPTEVRAKLAFELGEVDTLEGVFSPSPFEKWENFVNIESITDHHKFTGVFFNNSDPALQDKKVRQALSYSIDKAAFNSDRAISPISPRSWAWNAATKPYEFDIEHAKSLLPNKAIEIKLATTPALLDIAEKIAKNWSEIGVKTTVQVAGSIPEQFQAYLAIYDIPSDPDQYSMWHSTQKETNITHYANVRVDKILEDGRVELDEAKRKLIYLDFQRFLLEDAPVAILYHPISYTIKRK